MKMFKKQCVVCGKEFEAVNSNYRLCSDECRKVRKKMWESTPKYKEMHTICNKARSKRKNRLHPKIVPCKICGKPVDPDFNGDRMSRKHYHESCVLSEALQAVSEGFGFNDKRIRRAKNVYAYTLEELRERW